jgi:hypothetical protein
MCRQLVGYINTNGITHQALWRGRAIATKARELLPPDQAARFQPLSTLKEDMPQHWTFIDLSAHVASYTREAGQ